MKLIIAIVNQEDAKGLASGLSEVGLTSTTIATTGGFLKQGNATMLIGVEEARLSEVLSIIKDNCEAHVEVISSMPPIEMPGGVYTAGPMEVQVGGAIVFILNVEDVYHF